MSGGSSGSGDMIGHHMTIAEPSSTTCSRKCSGSCTTAVSTITGQCVISRTPLKIRVATSGRVTVRQARSTHGGDSTFRHIHAGIPATSIGAATSVYSRCWTMCAVYQTRSARSCNGHIDPTNSTAIPARNNRRTCGVVTSPVSRSWRRAQIR